MTMRCYVMGHGALTLACCQHLQKSGLQILGVLTSYGELRDWAAAQRIDLLDDVAAMTQAFADAPAELLFSIINPHKVGADLLAAPRVAAFNFHDAALPDYAGLHVTSWAVQNQEVSHGVTWHLMSASFDAGDIVVQKRFDLDPEETAFTLSLKCHNEGIETFKTLVNQLLANSWHAIPQSSSEGSTYLRSQRPPAACLIDWQASAESIDALVRGLTYASDRNPLGLPKFKIGATYYLLCAVDLVQQSPPGSAGTVLICSDGTLEVKAANGALRLNEIRSLAGELMTPAELTQRHQLQQGEQLPIASIKEREALSRLDQRWQQQESYWTQVLQQAAATNPFHRLQHKAVVANPAVPQQREYSGLPPALVESVCALFGSEEANSAVTIAALYYCFLSRLAGSEQTSGNDCWVSLDASGSDGFHEDLCARDRPFALRLDHAMVLDAAVDAVRQAIQIANARPGYLLDLLVRDPALQPQDYPLRICFGTQDANAFAQAGVVLHACTIDAQSGFSFPAGGEQAAHYQRHALLFQTFLQAALGQPQAPVKSVRYLTEAQHDQVVHRFNDTVADLSAERSICAQIEAQVSLQGEATALVYQDQALSYRGLSERARTMAQGLIDGGVKPDTLVGIYLPRSIDMVVAMVAVHYAGAAYVPLDPGYPMERVAFMIADAQLAHIVTNARGSGMLADTGARLWRTDQPTDFGDRALAEPVAVSEHHLAYVIYTSGSTGNPKGVMVEHGNLVNFMVAMDQVLGYEGSPGVWLAVTSMSFDISVLELLWTLARGFKVVVQEDTLAARHMSQLPNAHRKMDFSLFYFSSDAGPRQADSVSSRYRLLLEGAQYADKNDFSAIWTPERHFHLFGGLYPNPSVTSAAVAAVTERISIRAGSIVLPLHHPVRVAEEWSVVDNLSNGRVGFSFASGWHANDFALRPENYESRKQLMYDGIETVLQLWRGETVTMTNGEGKPFDAKVFPPPVQERPPIWITAAGNVETFEAAGTSGQNLLTNLLGQTVAELKTKIEAYQQARTRAGFTTPGAVSVMVHTFIGTNVEAVRRTVKAPFCHYLKTSFDLVKIAPWAFPAFSQPSKKHAQDKALDTDSFTDEDLDALIEHAFDRYFETAGLFGTPESVLPLVDELKGAGVTEVACLVDFGVAEDEVLASLPALNQLRVAAMPVAADNTVTQSFSVAEQVSRHGVTHFQCTPSMARILWSDSQDYDNFRPLQHVLLGGEALPADLAQLVAGSIDGQLTNVYGPTETTIWSTAAVLAGTDENPSIGRPIANTQVYLLDSDQQPVPVGVPGELCIGGAGVVRGYHQRPELTREKFVPDPFAGGSARMYRTGDLAAWSEDGSLQFLGRLDQQVKLRGYRIEMGEIEARLNALQGVRESAVLAHEQGTGEAALLAYVVPDQSAQQALAVASWEGLWSDAYSGPEPDGAQDTLNTSGWLDSFTGEQHDQKEMAQWVSAACDRILELKPKRVLEVGCGTGMLLFGIAPHCEHYLATDVSEVALANLRSVLDQQQLDNVALAQCAATEIAQFDTASFDVVVLNSVVQYFPSGAYLADVIRAAVDGLRPGGHLFIGDVRSLQTAPLFYQTVEWHLRSDADSVQTLRSRIAARQQAESELLCDPNYFRALAAQCPDLSAIRVRLKAESAHNEMSMFRYDVVLRKADLVARSAAPVNTPMMDARKDAQLQSIDGVTARVAQLSAPVAISGLRNARLWAAAELQRQLAAAPAEVTLESLVYDPEQLRTLAVDPAELLAQLPQGTAQISWDTQDAGAMCLQILEPVAADAGFEPLDTALFSAADWTAFCNQPVQPDPLDALKVLIKTQLGRQLPDFMVPSETIILDALPLTPNGKIDRKRLPAPAARAAATSDTFEAPSNALQTQIAEVFCDMLNLAAVGVHDNFFDIGANSLLIVQANARLSRQLGRKVPLVSMYRFPTVASLAKQLEAVPAEAAPAAQAPAKALDRAARRKQARAGRKRRSAGQGS